MRQNTFPCQNLSECVALPIFLVLCCPPLGTAGCKAGCRIFSTVCRGHTHRVPRGSGAAPLPVMTPDAPMHLLRRGSRAMLNFGHARPRHAPRQRRPARAPRGLGCDQSGDALCTRRSAYLAATKVWRCAQYGRTQSRPKWIRAQYGAGCRRSEWARKAKVGRRNGLFRVRKKSKPRGRASVVLRTHKSILRVAVVSSLISLKKSALLGIHGANSGAVSDVDVNATAAVSATCDGVACQTPRLWAH